MPAATCPNTNQLEQYAVGTLPDSLADRVIGHVDSCAVCQSQLDALAGKAKDHVVAQLRGAAVPTDPFVDEQAFQRALNAVRQFGQQPSATEKEKVKASSSGEPKLLRDYRVLEKLGEGGMGTVYKALHTKLEKVVALKLLPADRMKDTQAVDRFHREMKAVGRIEHPNIVRASDAGEADGRHFLVMEYVDGVDLAALTSRTGQLPVAEACELIRQAAAGLQHVHENGMVHRDIKASNIMVTSDARVKILDLGLALLHDEPAETGRKINESGDISALSGSDLTAAGQLMGTLNYMAPEQLDDSHQVDIRADVYSLGATLFKLLTGRAPLDDGQLDTPMKKMMALTSQTAPQIRKRRSDVPELLAQVIKRMLAKQPGQRFETPAQVATALTPFAESSDLAGWLAGALDQPLGEVSTEKLLSVDGVETVAQRREATKTDGFDPYHKWLAIPPSEQPPHHYRLLGLELYESDAEVIEVSADRQMSHVRTFQAGKRSKESQKLLNEIASAKVCLLNAAKKAAYDEKLKQKLAQQQQPAAPVASAPVAARRKAAKPATAKRTEPTPQSKPDEPSASAFQFTKSEQKTAPRQTHRRRSTPKWLPFAIGGGVLAAGILIVALILSLGPDDTNDDLAKVDKKPKPPVTDPEPSPKQPAPVNPIPKIKPEPPPPDIPAPGELIETPPATQYVPPTGEIDLLALFEPSSDIADGQWTHGADGGLTTDETRFAIASMPALPDGSYKVSANLTRLTGIESVNFMLPVDGFYCQFVLGGGKNTLCGFQKLSGRDISQHGDGKNHTAEVGRAYNVEVTVIRDGGNVTLDASLDGQSLDIKWTGLPSDLSVSGHWRRLPYPGVIGVGTYGSSWKIDDLKLTMLRGQAKHARTQGVLRPAPSQTIDLLALTDPNQDAIRGDWSKQSGRLVQALKNGSGQPNPALNLPARPDGSYELVMTFTRDAYGGGTSFQLPVGRRHISLNIGGRDGTIAGVSGINGLAYDKTDNPTRKVLNPTMSAKTPHTVRARVELLGDRILLSVYLNGDQIISWNGPPPASSGIPRPMGISMWTLPMTFHKIELKILSGNANLTRGGPPIDLLALTDPKQDAIRGDWSKSGGRLVQTALVPGGGNTPIPTLHLPALPDGSYELAATFAREGSGGSTFALPVGPKHVALIVGGRGGTDAGVNGIFGLDYADKRNPTTRKVSLSDGKLHTVRARVRVQGEQVQLLTHLNGKQLFQWDGKLADIKPLGPDRFLGLNMWSASMTYERIELTVLSGNANLKRGSSVLNPDVPSASVDLLAMIDPAKDVTTGTWRRDGSKLISDPNGPARINVPVEPQGSYQLTVKLTRIAGIDSASVRLPVGSGRHVTFGIHGWTDLGEGGMSGLQPINGKDIPNNETLHQKFQLVDGQEHRFDIEVRLKENDQVAIQAFADSQRIVNWSGPRTALSDESANYNKAAFGLTSWESSIVYSEARLTMLNGEARDLRTGKVIWTSSPPHAAPGDLLKLVDLDKDLLSGDWERTGSALKSRRGAPASIQFPVELDGDYNLRVKLKRVAGRDGANILLPVGNGRQVHFTVGGWPSPDDVGQSGLQFINGKKVPENGTGTTSFQVVDGNEHTIDIEIRNRDDQIVITARADGRPFFEWTGPHTALSGDPRYTNKSTLGLSSYQSSYVFSEARLTMVSGAAKLLRPGGVPMIPNVLPSAKKYPVPSKQDFAELRKQVEEIYTNIKTAKTAEEKANLAKVLRKAANDRQYKPNAKFVLLDLARDFAAESSQLELANQIVDQLAATYDVKAIEMKTEVLSRAAPRVASKEALGQAAALVNTLFDEALADDAFDLIAAIGKSGRTLAAKSNDRAFGQQVSNRMDEASALRKKFNVAEKARDAIDKDPDDPKANLAVGRYEAFQRDRWAIGLPFLTKSGEEEIAAASKAELATPTTAADQAKLGKLWHDASNSVVSVDKPATIRRAGHWYVKALPGLNGIQKSAVEKWLDQIGPFDLIGQKDFIKRDLILLLAFNPAEFSKNANGEWFALDLSSSENHGKIWDANASDRPPADGFLPRRIGMKKSFGVGKTPFTAAAWVLASSAITNGDGNHGRGVLKCMSGEKPGDWMLSVKPDGKVVFFHYRGNGSVGMTTTAPHVRAKQWCHLSVVWDGRAVHMYVNGQQVAYKSHKGAGKGWGGGSWVGTIYGGSGFHWYGKIDNVFIFNRALSPQEIFALSRISPGPTLSQLK
jgi:serine/threonine protein kinase